MKTSRSGKTGSAGMSGGRGTGKRPAGSRNAHQAAGRRRNGRPSSRSKKLARRRPNRKNKRRSLKKFIPRGKRTKLKNRGQAAKPAISSGYHRGYSEGYKTGYEHGIRGGAEPPQPGAEYHAGHERGYREGLYDGGEAIVDQLLPAYEIVPDLTLRTIIQSGLAANPEHRLPLITAEAVQNRILESLNSRSPLALVRLGDGELLTLAQDLVLPIEQVKAEGHFLPYAGVEIPDLEARDQLMASLRRAQLVGVPSIRKKNYQPLAFEIFRAMGLTYREMPLTNSLVNFHLYEQGRLPSLLAGRRILAVGNRAEELAAYLRARGYAVAGAVAPVQGVKDVPVVMERIHQHDFDIALISAGVAAVILAERTANELGKVAIDFGHMADVLIKGAELG